MNTNINFKFDIGDRVKLVKEVPFQSRTFDGQFYVGLETVVLGYGWDHDKDGLKIWYLLDHRDCKYLRPNNRVPEDCLNSIKETRPHIEECVLRMADNTPIEVGQYVYWHIIENYFYQKPPTPNTNFSFAGYGPVVSIHFQKDEFNKKGFVKMRREFLCEDEDGKNYGDSRRYGNIQEDKPKNIYLTIPENYPNMFVDEVIKRHTPGYPTELDEQNKNWYYEVKAWLTHIGVYERVMELYRERSKKLGLDKELGKLNEKKKKERRAKLNAIIKTLSAEEIEELKTMI